MSLREYLYMGGYGFYVWGSFGVAFVVMAAEVISLRRRRRALEKSLRINSNGNSQERI